MSAALAPTVARVERLIRLATDPGATEHEARTSALIACKTIRAHGLRLLAELPAGDDHAYSRAYEAGFVDGRAVAERNARQPAPPRRIITSRYRGSCHGCGNRYEPGDRIAWCPTSGAVCIECHRRDAA
jgi:hypothetical protein